MPEPEARNPGHAFALVLVDELARHGVTDAVLAPGSRSTPIALALAANKRIRLHVRIDERSASYLALGLAKASGRPVPVLCTSGTAVAHFHGAALEADQARVPLLLLTADRPPELRGVGANQTVDQVGIYGSAVRWSVDVGVPESRADSVRYWRSLVSRAVAVSLGRSAGPAGPVHLNLPLREPLTPVDDGTGFPYSLDGRAGGAPWTSSARAETPLPTDVVERIESARRGVVVAGDGLSTSQALSVVQFAHGGSPPLGGWPLIAEPHSTARRGTHSLRGTDAILGSATFTSAHRPDLVVVAGRVGLSRTLLGWLETVPHVVVDRDGLWSDPTRTAEEVVRADTDALAHCEISAENGWAAAWTEAAAQVGAAVDAVLDESAELTEPRVARDVAALLPDTTPFVVGSSMPIRDLDLLMERRVFLEVVANRGVSGIDGFVSTAAGVALARGEHAVALCGDLSLLHDSNGLIADPTPNLTLVVVNNDGGGIFSMLPQATGDDAATFERLFGTPHGVDLAGLAASYGTRHQRVGSPAELREAIAEWPDGLRIIEVRTDRAANADLHRRMREAAAAAIR